MKETDSKVTGAFFNKVYSSICVPCTEVSHEGDSTTIILQNWIFFIPPIETFSLPSLRWAWIVSWHHVHVEHTQQNHDLQKRYFLHLNIPFFFLWKFARPCQGFWLAYSKYLVSKMKCDGKPSNDGRGLKKMREVWFIYFVLILLLCCLVIGSVL